MAEFPFFGAGEARYFEYASLTVRFASSPRGKKRAALLEHLPAPFQDGVDLVLRSASPVPIANCTLSLGPCRSPADSFGA